MKPTTTKQTGLWINTQADSWVTEKFPGAIRIARNCPPFAFGEDVAAIHPTLGIEFVQGIIRAVNEHAALVAVAEAAESAVMNGAMLLDAKVQVMAALNSLAAIRKAVQS